MTSDLRPAAGVLPIRLEAGRPAVYMVQRGSRGRFFPGFHAFPGGAAEAGEDLRRCAARELWEETGLWVGPRQPGPEHKGLGLEELEADYPLELDRLIPAGVRTTPSYAFIRFRAQFYLWECPPDQQASVCAQELEAGAWWDVAEAIAAWSRGEVFWAAPTQDSMLGLAGWLGYRESAATLAGFPEDTPDPIRIRPGLAYVPLETPTLPPARHTLCFLLGEESLWIVDPGSADPAELERLHRVVGERPVLGVLATHHHPDHIGGLAWCRDRGWPIAAHPASGLEPDRLLQDGDSLGESWRVLHTPGHAPGHLALWDESARILLAGDLVSAVSTILIPAEAGAMKAYLESLRRCIGLRPELVVPSHGGPYGPGSRLLERTLAHRLEREDKVRQALGGDLEQLLERAYADVQGPARELARISLRSILLKLEEEGQARQEGERWLPA